MTARTMRARISTPAGELDLGPITALRLLAEDGWWGVLPGHEPARARVLDGPLRCTTSAGETRWLASEGGVAIIDRDQLRILTSWAVEADSLTELRARVEAREAERRRLEAEARTLAQRHELATRRALVALERKITLP